MQIISIILLLLTLSSCALTTPPIQILPQPKPAAPLAKPMPPSTRPAYNLSGYPAAMKTGYIDGCETAKNTIYGNKDESRYETDGQYQIGWNDGFDLCRKK